MGILTADMKRVLDEQQLGFIATVTPDGKPNLSPKGTTRAWDDDHLVFADICSPGTIENLQRNPAIEINVVDPIVRKGYRFKGEAAVLSSGPQYEEIEAWFRAHGSQNAFRHIVLVKVTHAAELISPAYDLGRTEAEVAGHWEKRRDDLRKARDGNAASPRGNGE
ncbi:MAG TPA: pyridoxamine 5'-phosphate oxidase family protein [Hyphomonadaceae bacterium]|jgi:predicted pyridoxine 5'-phosphate oxidase superfamily flavin-nucleotide-binding protein|nr:pyridoxamine 5'-phosphate oxidase family protein [Hyphomonadaceae bacterium]